MALQFSDLDYPVTTTNYRATATTVPDTVAIGTTGANAGTISAANRTTLDNVYLTRLQEYDMLPLNMIIPTGAEGAAGLKEVEVAEGAEGLEKVEETEEQKELRELEELKIKIDKLNLNIKFKRMDEIEAEKTKIKTKIETLKSQFDNFQKYIITITNIDAKIGDTIQSTFEATYKIHFNEVNKNEEEINTLNMELSEIKTKISQILYVFRFKNCTDKYLCTICSENDINTVYECGHNCCETCHNRMNNKCPFCRTPVKGIKLYNIE